MKLKVAILIISIVTGSLAAVILLMNQSRSPEVSLTMKFSVEPADRVQLVLQECNSARFKYLVGKNSGLKPVLAQKLTVKPLSQGAGIEANVATTSREEAERYRGAFVEILQWQCGKRASVNLIEDSIR